MTTLYTRELPTMLRVADVAAYLNVCTRVAYRIVKQPGFPLVVLTNKSWRIPREAFLTWLEEEPGTKKLIEARKAKSAPPAPDGPRVYEKSGNGTGLRSWGAMRPSDAATPQSCP